jgi:hypothetical protein
MTRRLLTFILVATAASAPVAAAEAAKPAPYPSIAKVAPLQLGVGDTLTITGKHFRPGANKNTVVFKRDGKKAIFVKAHAATATSLTVVVPEKLRAALGRRNGVDVATRFRLRVLARRFAKRYTALKASPTVVPGDAPAPAPLLEQIVAATQAPASAAAAAAGSAGPAPTAPVTPSDCDRDGTPDALDPHDDADGLDDALELQIGTQLCNADTDGDSLEDGWEYKSAFDLNRESCPDTAYPVPCSAIPLTKYPKKRPYPNPLDPSDSGTDFDGDWLTATEEHDAWSRKVGQARNMAIPLWYSDGLQASIDDAHTNTCMGMRVPPVLNDAAKYSGPEYQVYSLDQLDWGHAGDGCLDDAERDEDGDFLANFVESHQALSAGSWWEGVFSEPLFRVEYAGTDWLDRDTDGDGVVDGLDDQDHDDFWNLEEIVRGYESVTKDGISTDYRYGLWVDPFNPCLPSIHSRTCPPAIPVSGSVWRPFWRTGDEAPKPRWPLYDSKLPVSERRPYTTEWEGLPTASQTMPPVHPLPRCFGEEAPAC